MNESFNIIRMHTIVHTNWPIRLYNPIGKGDILLASNIWTKQNRLQAFVRHFFDDFIHFSFTILQFIFILLVESNIVQSKFAICKYFRDEGVKFAWNLAVSASVCVQMGTRCDIWK